MKVTIAYFGQLTTMTGLKEEEQEVSEGTDIRTLLKSRADHFGEAYQNLLFKDEGLRVSNIITLNDQLVDKKTPTPLSEGDVLMVHTPIGGG